MLMTKTAPTKA